jgi:hypothetical protein
VKGRAGVLGLSGYLSQGESVLKLVLAIVLLCYRGNTYERCFMSELALSRIEKFLLVLPKLFPERGHARKTFGKYLILPFCFAE